jgi:hypothetical protein
MPVTTNADGMSVVHASSSGVNTIFPDVCKVPAPPAPPIPVPMPNIGQSSDTADGSSTVKVDGNPIMTKSSNYNMSSGDEAGTLFGLVSSKNKGKALPILYATTVKTDGANTFRLTDIMQQNCGGSGNTPPGTTVEPPVIGIPGGNPPCDNTKKKVEKQSGPSTSWPGNSGVIGPHQSHFQSAATQLKMVIYIRQTKEVCGKWIAANHQPKPHSCMEGTTIKGDADVLEKVQAWLNEFFEAQGKGTMQIAEMSHSGSAAHKRMYTRVAAAYVGIIGQEIKPGFIRPLTGAGRQTISYSGKWMTGDYDLFEVLLNGGGCIKVQGDAFALLKKLVNHGCNWDAIQHPPQAQWVPNKHERSVGVNPINMNSEVKAVLQPGADRTKEIPVIPNRNKMKVLDKPLTLVAGEGAAELKDQDAVAEALICQECDK